MSRSLPLEGIKITDFTWMGQGPLATKTLADWGATVVKIESRMRLDQHRAMAPMIGGVPGVNRCAPFFRYNSSKYSIALNLKSPDGREVAKRLVQWGDVVTENFIPGTLEKWGFGYDDLRQVKPDLILIRGSMQGQDGYYAKHPGFGTHIMGLSAYADLVGWPDRLPSGISSPVTDFIGAWYYLLAILGALDFRRRTGKGQCVDMAQLEAGLTLLCHNALNFSANKRLTPRVGNSHPKVAPHGVYKCKGDDAWCCLAVFNEAEWQSLCKAMGKTDLANDPAFATMRLRKENEARLDGLIEDWTQLKIPKEVVAILQAAKIPSGMVKNGEEVCADPQLAHRGHFVDLEQPDAGNWPHENVGFRMAKHVAKLKPAPCLGEHTEFVCRELLGMSDQEFVELYIQGIFE